MKIQSSYQLYLDENGFVFDLKLMIKVKIQPS